MNQKSKYEPHAQLIINADDYGYYNSVSHGILDLGMSGAITATGIMANSNIFNECIPKLNGLRGIDFGVHLNLTFGTPLTSQMKSCLSTWGYSFPGKVNMAMAILKGEIDIKVVTHELKAQITRCIDAGLNLHFLNSHEHIHMLPPIYKKTIELARLYNIPFVRFSEPEWSYPFDKGSISRNMVFQILNLINYKNRPNNSPKLIGLNASGKLSIAYLKHVLIRLQQGHVYELMCHPGHFDMNEITDKSLINYHRWESELAVLQSAEFRDLVNKNNIKLLKYSDILK